MTREQVLDLCYQARTLEEIEIAKRARGEWLTAHPDDATVLDVGEMLCMLEDAIRDTDVTTRPPTVVAAR
jgi:hypothetical protein